MEPVLVRGDGVAASCCVHLLGQAGIPVRHDRPTRHRLPAIMLSESAIALIADVFGRKDLFRDLPRIESRSVLWGPGATEVALPHSAVVMSEEALLDSIRSDAPAAEGSGDPAWHVYASRPLPEESAERGFGSRMAHASIAALREGGEPGCWAESVECGWLFLIGDGTGKGWLLSVGGTTAQTLGQSRLVARQIAGLGEAGGVFPAFPRMADPLCGSQNSGRGVSGNWMACGTAAVAFDPLCGDGTANAIREAILTAAVIRAAYTGADIDQVLAHYEARVTAGFRKHLVNCAGFYRTGGEGRWWREELDSVERGVAWCGEKMSMRPSFRYRLNGYELEPVA
jgi:hypothetical protein